MKINLGCGMTPTPGWINFDNSLSVKLSRLPSPITGLLQWTGVISSRNLEYINFCRMHNISYADVRRGIPIPDACVDAVYSSHMLEHLTRDEAAAFMREARRVLKPGGVFRIAVPDLALKIREYALSDDADAFIDSLDICKPLPRTLLARIGLICFVGIRHHQWFYDGRSLCRLMTEHAFSSVQVLPPGVTSISEPGQLDLAERFSESVYVEGKKSPYSCFNL